MVGNHSGNGTAIGNERQPPATIADTYSVAEAAELLGLPARTLRDRVKKGKIPALPTERGYRLAAAVVNALRQPLATPATSPAIDNVAGGNRQYSPATLPGLAERLEASETRELALLSEVKELRRVETEATFLRDRLAAADLEKAALLESQKADRERHAAELMERHGAERELRVLLLKAQETTQALAARIETPQALPASSEPERRWWKIWRRRQGVG